MNFRESAKHVLRMCGHAMVSTIHERLNVVDQVLQDVTSQNSHLARTQTALLQSGIHIVEQSGQMRTDLQKLESRLETLEYFANQSVRQICVETSDYLATNPEVGLLSFIYSYLPSRKVLDVGAHVGEFSEHLIRAGFEVYAFEPYAENYRRLNQRVGDSPNFHSFDFALGNVTGDLPLYLATDRSPDKKYGDPSVFHSLAKHGMPDDLPFCQTVPARVRRIADLHKEGILPCDIALAKIDTEGYDLEVIRGMEDHHYPVVMAEFWDLNIPFGNHDLPYTLEMIISEMRRRTYLWYIVIYRLWGQNQTAFFCNHERPVPESWGNVIFFRERELFAEAQQWCSAVLPRTYFRPVTSAQAPTRCL